MLLILPLGGEGTWAVRTGSSIVMETPDFCWLMDLRVKVSPNVTEKRAQEQFSGVSPAGSQLPSFHSLLSSHSPNQMCQLARADRSP